MDISELSVLHENVIILDTDMLEHLMNTINNVVLFRSNWHSYRQNTFWTHMINIHYSFIIIGILALGILANKAYCESFVGTWEL